MDPLPKIPFYFIRHGQTDWNIEDRLQGHTDTPLNETGLDQAHQALLRLQNVPIDLIVASPLIRAAKTALIIAKEIDLPVYFDDALKERYLGSLEGKLAAEVKKEHGLQPEVLITSLLPPDAEKWSEVLARNVMARTRWLTRFKNKTILFCDHGANFSALFEHTHNGQKMKAENAVPYFFKPTTQGWELEEVCSNALLSTSLARKTYGRPATL
jgi:broad specificity phosphatase PhoE